MKKKILLSLVAAVLVIGAALYWFATIPAAEVPVGAVSRARYQPGPFDVIDEQFTRIDQRRPTQAYRDFPGLPTRTLEGEIWRPAGLSAPGPLVVYSHGYLSFRREGVYLTRFLASHGYTVVAVDYPLTGMRAPAGPSITDVINQPGDISLVLDTLLARNADPADPLHDTIDPARIAVAGVSLGGLTSILAALHPTLRDPRISALVSIAGPTTVFLPEFFQHSELPFLLVYGSNDAIIPLENNALPVLRANPAAILAILKNASHAGFAQPASTIMRFIGNPDSVGCSVVVEQLRTELEELQGNLIAHLGSTTDGVDVNGKIEVCTSQLTPVAMKASRQHMFTVLAVHAFLDSLFAPREALREAAHDYLLRDLPAENGAEVTVRGAGAAIVRQWM